MYKHAFLTPLFCFILIWLPNDGLFAASIQDFNPFITSNSDPLPPEQAYRLVATVVAPNKLQLIWNIASGTYLYKERVKLELEDSTNVALDEITLPPGTIKHNAIRPDGEPRSLVQDQDND
ncbi:hypothetical protein TI03_07350 [Achromatium sp. WMS1]|nr:hypothetical protein TI03_07350 [Achromatium sp. WMS1]